MLEIILKTIDTVQNCHSKRMSILRKARFFFRFPRLCKLSRISIPLQFPSSPRALMKFQNVSRNTRNAYAKDVSQALKYLPSDNSSEIMYIPRRRYRRCQILPFNELFAQVDSGGSRWHGKFCVHSEEKLETLCVSNVQKGGYPLRDNACCVTNQLRKHVG